MMTWNALYLSWNRLKPAPDLNPEPASKPESDFHAISLFFCLRYLPAVFICCLLLVFRTGYAQNNDYVPIPDNNEKPECCTPHLHNSGIYSSYFHSFYQGISHISHFSDIPDITGPATLNYRSESFNSATQQPDTVPKPGSVLRKSMILPGWGQVVNKQTWKVPVIYGLFGGLAYYSILSNRNYRDYRAAYYNSRHPDGDERFGPTPDYINPNQNPESLRFTRNMFRNRRDLTFIGMGLAYGLNIIDAYVFAHMRDFDVSDDLSARINLGTPAVIDPTVSRLSFAAGHSATGSYGVSFTITLNVP